MLNKYERKEKTLGSIACDGENSSLGFIGAVHLF